MTFELVIVGAFVIGMLVLLGITASSLYYTIKGDHRD